MSEDQTKDAAAMPPASAGSQPVAWAVELARKFHETYERLAPQYGYETRRDTRDFDPHSPNGRLMCAVIESIGKPTLTDEEREAIGFARSVFEDYKMSCLHNAADEVLERLLQRTK